VGTWEWNNGTEKFTLVISKQKLLFDLLDDEIYYRDYLVCWHTYIKNNHIIESMMDKANLKATTLRNAHDISRLTGSLSTNGYPRLIYEDIKLNKTGKAKLTMIPGKTDEATWELYADD
jgi:hypothetical protein